jgi:GH24 family phage-related lysozyme (muramidase)
VPNDWATLAGLPWGDPRGPLGVGNERASHHGSHHGRGDVWAPQLLDFELLYRDLKLQEGMVLYMYLDTAKPPRVTIGAGNMLPNVPAATTLPFVNTTTNAKATSAEIAFAFHSVASMKGGQGSQYYEQDPSIEITEEKAKELAITRLKNEFIPLLRRHFVGFDRYPVPARRALIDMIYNMGWSSGEEARGGKPHHGLITFEALRRAAEAGEWKTAALHCHRRDTHPNTKKPSHAAKRNEWTKGLFEEADRIANPGQGHGPHPGH